MATELENLVPEADVEVEGMRGPKGDKGDSYVLTEADKEEIARKVDTIIDAETDKSLTISGKPADAKAAGDKINNLKADLSDLEEAIEHIDVETDTTLSVSGKPADSKTVGNKIDLINSAEYEYFDFITGYYIRNDGNTVNINSPVKNVNQRYCVIDVKKGDAFYLNINNGSAARGYSFIDDSSNILEPRPQQSDSLLGVTITAPQNAVKLILNDNLNESHYAYKISPLVDIINQINSDINTLQENPLFRKVNSYNLVDFSDMLYNTNYFANGKYSNTTNHHTLKDLIAVEPGSVITCNYPVAYYYFFDENRGYVSRWASASFNNLYEAVIIPENIYYVKPVWNSQAYSASNGLGLPEGEIPSIYITENYGARSDERPVKPKTQIDGIYITDRVYDTIIPPTGSLHDLVSKCRQIKRYNREMGAIRIGTFNIYGAMIKYKNWSAVKKICTEYGLDVCGFQEVPDSTKWSETNIPLYSFSKYMIGEVFAHSNLDDTDPDGAANRVLSGLAMSSGEYVTFEYTVGSTTKTSGYSHALIDLPNYHHTREWNKKLSMYCFHFSTTKVESEATLEVMASVIAADTNEYIAFVADTNCFSVDQSTGKPWIWSHFEEMGLHPCATDFTKSTYCNPISSASWSNSNLDFIDNVFVTDNMRCVKWGVVDSKDYPVSGASGGYVSDHCMLYADVIFDYVDNFDNSISDTE